MCFSVDMINTLGKVIIREKQVFNKTYTGTVTRLSIENNEEQRFVEHTPTTATWNRIYLPIVKESNDSLTISQILLHVEYESGFQEGSFVAIDNIEWTNGECNEQGNLTHILIFVNVFWFTHQLYCKYL